MVVIDSSIRPKEVNHEHEGHKFKCSYDPHAPTEKCWVWQVKFVQTYTFVGSAPTLALAVRRARRKIHSLNREEHDAEEHGE